MKLHGKLISLLLCAVMLLGVLPLGVFAAKGDEDLLVLLSDDFEDYQEGEFPKKETGKWTAHAANDTARIVAYNDDGNMVAKMYHNDPKAEGAAARSPRMEIRVPTKGLTKLTVEYDIKSSGGDSVFRLILLNEETRKTLANADVPYDFRDWTHIRVEMDFVEQRLYTYAEDELVAEKKCNVGELESFLLRFAVTVALDGSWIMVDNVKVTSPDKALDEGIVSLDGTRVNFDAVTVEGEARTGITDVMRKSHPRIYLHDWADIQKKIDSDPDCYVWGKAIIDSADESMRIGHTAYFRNARNNINDCSTAFKKNIVPVIAAYCLTKEQKYRDFVYAELENVGSWPDWGSDAYLCTAHIIFAFGLAYDWMYNDWTAQERENIAGWLIDKGMTQAVLAYEGKISSGWTKGNNNWNMVCNGSNLVGALAIADAYPEITEYIASKAAEGLPYCFFEMAPDGAYAEPLSYWDYGIRHMVKAMAALDTVLEDGKKLPETLDFKDVTGIDTTGDFPIYYNGTVLAFNYGDGSQTMIVTPIMYYLANKFNKPQYAWYNLYTTKNNPNVYTEKGKEAVLSLLWYDPDNAAMPEGGFSLDKFYKSDEKKGANGMSMRSSWTDNDGMYVGINAGDIARSHAAMDHGGFVLDWAGKRWVHMYGRTPAADIPGGVYSWPDYHTKSETGHFMYYHTRAEANNTIIANPQQDKADMSMSSFSKMLRNGSSDKTAFGIIDMTTTNADFTDAKRGFMLTDNRSRLVIQDEITASKPSEFYWFTNTLAEITISEDGKSALWTQDEDKMLIRITQGPADAKFAVMQTMPLPTSPDPEIQADIPEHKMYIHMQGHSQLNLTVEFTPLGEGEGAPAPLPVVPLADWKVDEGEAITSQSLGDIVALKVDNPNAYAKGAKTYVDTENLEIAPIVQNGRTLVPVRFIAEKFGAKVGWDAATETVTVTTDIGVIKLQIGSDKMYVDGKQTILDVPAQTIGGRTLIPLRALVEALGKQVFWDDRGLILISDDVLNYDADRINKVIDLLDIRVQTDGKEIKFFDSEVYDYTVKLAKGAPIPIVTASAAAGASVVQGNPATVTVGDKNYTIRFTEDLFEGRVATDDATMVKKLIPSVETTSALPNYQTYMTVQSATSSIAWTEKYPMTGSYDGIINEQTANRWSAEGAGNWVCYDFGEVKNLHGLNIAGYKALSRSYVYEVSVSNDGVNFTKVTDAVTQIGIDHTAFALGGVQARYVKLTCTSATNTTWCGLSEVRFYDSAQMMADDLAAWDMYFHELSINDAVGESFPLKLKFMNAAGGEVDAVCENVVYKSLNTKVATVDANGVITLVGKGTTRVQVTATVNGILLRGEIEVIADERK